MSSKGLKLTCQQKYAERLAEICGSGQPADVARKLKISYQAAKNYLGGRFPDSSVLLMIAEQTPYCIHWLLTGKGSKFVEDFSDVPADTPLLTDQMRSLVREELREIFNIGLSGEPFRPAQSSIEQTSENNAGKMTQRVIRLKSAQIRREKLPDQTDILAENKVVKEKSD